MRYLARAHPRPAVLNMMDRIAPSVHVSAAQYEPGHVRDFQLYESLPVLHVKRLADSVNSRRMVAILSCFHSPFVPFGLRKTSRDDYWGDDVIGGGSLIPRK